MNRSNKEKYISAIEPLAEQAKWSGDQNVAVVLYALLGVLSLGDPALSELANLVSDFSKDMLRRINAVDPPPFGLN